MAEHLTEEQQVEAIKSWWKENGMAVIAGLVIGFVALFGWRYWGEYKETRAVEASTLYGSFTESMQQGVDEAAKATADRIISEYASTPYAALVAMSLAKHAVENNELAEARKQLQWVLDNGRQQQLLHAARLRMAALMLNDGEHDAALALLASAPAGGYQAAYEEMRGDILFAKGDKAGANAAYDAALKLEGLSPANRQVIEAKLADTATQTDVEPEPAGAK